MISFRCQKCEHSMMQRHVDLFFSPAISTSVRNTSVIIARYGLSNAKLSIVDFILQPLEANWQ